MPMLVANLLGGYTVDYGVLMLGVFICNDPDSNHFLLLPEELHRRYHRCCKIRKEPNRKGGYLDEYPPFFKRSKKIKFQKEENKNGCISV